MMRAAFVLLAAGLFAATIADDVAEKAYDATGPSDSSDEEWAQLFNMRDLVDWDIKMSGHELGVNYGNSVRVDDGLLKIRYDEYDGYDGRFAHIFYRGVFSHYRLRVEYRFLGEQVARNPGMWAWRNSGIMIHGQSAESMLLDQDFPISVALQLLGGDGNDERTTANLCTPGTHVVIDGELEKRHGIRSRSGTYHGDDWVSVEVLVLGDSVITHFVNGNDVLS